MSTAPPCKNGCITTKGHPSRHNEIRCPIAKRDRISQMDFSGIHLHFVKLTADEFARLSPPLQSTGTISETAINRSPEIPSPSPVRASYIPESPRTPTPVQSRRPLRSPIKQSRDPQLDVIDPALAYHNPPMSIAESTNDGSSTREEWEEDEEPQEDIKDVTRVLIIKSQFKERERSEVSEMKRRSTSEEMIYESNKRKRENYYKSTSECIRENMRKIDTITGCYDILYLSRHVLLFHPSTDYTGT